MNTDFVISLISSEKRSKRSKQVQVGPSEVGGCRRRVWHRLQGTPKTNQDTLIMAAWMGTTIHKDLERRLQMRDPFGERYEVEVSVEHNGMRGTVDVYDREECEVIDWKTSTKAGLKDFPSDQQRTQVHLYGYLLSANGREVKDVTLVGIPRDGNERQIVVHSEPYDPAIAEAGLEWLEDVTGRVEAPEPEKHRRFCVLYCPFYDASATTGCPGKGA